jgi:hypothetical protein
VAEQLLGCRAFSEWLGTALEAVKAAGCSSTLQALGPVLEVVGDITAGLRRSAQVHGSAAHMARADAAAKALLAVVVSDMSLASFQQLLSSTTSLQPALLQRLVAVGEGVVGHARAAAGLAAALGSRPAGDDARREAKQLAKRAAVQMQLMVQAVLGSTELQQLMLGLPFPERSLCPDSSTAAGARQGEPLPAATAAAGGGVDRSMQRTASGSGAGAGGAGSSGQASNHSEARSSYCTCGSS